eukprot:TRINITY_DN7466_c0_g1_i1.p1 TRINITY_DN7466_c0_g1~~TRINITY_DN7466_c0_g1_i1.p1  ORF type:complete len:208 (-),score=30.20 TRINITY_DN7466_c0_g1_i1:53-676(-)
MYSTGWEGGAVAFDRTDHEYDIKQRAEKKLYDFIRTFQKPKNVFVYREQLRDNYISKKYFLNILVNDVAENPDTRELGDHLFSSPHEYLPLFEKAAKRSILERNIEESEDKIHDIQVTLITLGNPIPIRELNPERHMSRLIRVSGIIVSAYRPQAKAINLGIRCRNCRTLVNIDVSPGFSTTELPKLCLGGGYVLHSTTTIILMIAW